MHPFHRIAIAAILGLAVIAGLAGMSRSLELGATPQKAGSPAAATIAARSHRLDRAQAALRAALARRPPPLPPVPTYSAPSVTPPAARPAARQVTYVRPPPRVVTVHRAGGGEGDDHAGGSRHEDD